MIKTYPSRVWPSLTTSVFQVFYFFLGKVFLSINQLMNNVYPAADTMSHLSSVQFSP